MEIRRIDGHTTVYKVIKRGEKEGARVNDCKIKGMEKHNS